jgi:hypothetical protein
MRRSRQRPLLTEIELIFDQRKSPIPIFRREILGGWLIVIQYEQILFNCANSPQCRVFEEPNDLK